MAFPIDGYVPVSVDLGVHVFQASPTEAEFSADFSITASPPSGGGLITPVIWEEILDDMLEVMRSRVQEEFAGTVTTFKKFHGVKDG